MNYERKNTISLNFGGIPQRIAPIEIHEFIQKNLKYRREEVAAIGIYGAKVFIKLASEDLVEKTIEEYDDGLEYIDDEKKTWKIELRDESANKFIKIHRIPLEIPNRAIEEALSHYGTVENIKIETWRNMPYECTNDTRSVKMQLKKTIPSYVEIAHKLYWITYTGQPKTCKRCNSAEHEAKDCDQSIRPFNYARALSSIHTKRTTQEKEFFFENLSTKQQNIIQPSTVLKGKETDKNGYKTPSKEPKINEKDTVGDNNNKINRTEKIGKEQIKKTATQETISEKRKKGDTSSDS